MVDFFQYLTAGLMLGSVYALMAFGFVIILKASGVLNLAQGMMVVMGVYFCHTFLNVLHLPLWASLPIALVCGAILGILLGRFAMNPLIGQPILALIIMSLAIFAILEGLITFIWGAEIQTFPRFFPLRSLTLGGVLFGIQDLSIFGISLCVFFLVWAYFQFTRTGLAMRAVAEGHEIAQSTGVDLRRVLMLVWMLAGIVACIGGFLLGTFAGVNTSLGEIALKSLAVILLGGVESIPGALVAGLIIGASEMLAAGYLDPLIAAQGVLGARVAPVIPYIILMLVLFIKPYGLFGLVKIERI